MVIIQPWPPQNPWDTSPNVPQPFEYPIPGTFVIKEPEMKERHIKEVKKGVLVKFEDGSWMFMATDDECYQKLKEKLNDETD